MKQIQTLQNGYSVFMHRHYYNNEELPVERINRLEYFSFVWNLHDSKWTEMNDRFVAYKKKLKLAQVPYRYTKDPSSGKWERIAYNNGNLPKKRIQFSTSAIHQLFVVSSFGKHKK
jgi:hypothetical protein